MNTNVPNLRTPCCNAPLIIFTAWEGGGYMSREVVDYIECEVCTNTWTPSGDSEPGNKMPTVHPAIQAIREMSNEELRAEIKRRRMGLDR